MKNHRTWIAAVSLALLLGTLSACIVEMRPDRSMLIYVPPPVLQSAGRPDLTVQQGTIPGTIPAPLALGLMEEAQRTLDATSPRNETATITSTMTVSITVTPTGTAVISGTRATTGTAAPTSSANRRSSTPFPPSTLAPPANPTGSGTRMVTPFPTRQATATTRATATRSATRTATATRSPTSTATRRATATPATPIATATPIPRTVFVGRNQGFLADASYFVVGEVLNGDSYPVFTVKVIGTFYDSNNNVVAAQESTTIFHQIEPELSSPFKLQVTNGASAIDHYELTLTWDDVSVIDYEELAVESTEVDDETGTITGELRNNGSVSVQNIAVVVTLYDDENDVVDVLSGTADKAVLGTDETTRYTIPLPAEIEFDRIEVQAQGALKLF